MFVVFLQQLSDSIIYHLVASTHHIKIYLVFTRPTQTVCKMTPVELNYIHCRSDIVKLNPKLILPCILIALTLILHSLAIATTYILVKISKISNQRCHQYKSSILIYLRNIEVSNSVKIAASGTAGGTNKIEINSPLLQFLR